MTVNGQERDGKRWIRADFHIHTPASEDYAEPQSTFLDILREAERHDLEIIAFTDHNTVHGYEQMRREIDFLQTLEQAQRLTADEQEQLGEYRRLLEKLEEADAKGRQTGVPFVPTTKPKDGGDITPPDPVGGDTKPAEEKPAEKPPVKQDETPKQPVRQPERRVETPVPKPEEGNKRKGKKGDG